jgi:cytochrome c oxidase subunit IV
MSLTLLTWMIGKAGYSGLVISGLVLGVALIKGVLIGDYFMGLKTVYSAWRWLIIAWLVIPASLIAIAFLVAVNHR